MPRCSLQACSKKMSFLITRRLTAKAAVAPRVDQARSVEVDRPANRERGLGPTRRRSPGPDSRTHLLSDRKTEERTNDGVRCPVPAVGHASGTDREHEAIHRRLYNAERIGVAEEARTAHGVAYVAAEK